METTNIVYTAKRVILLRHTDAAGVMFFARFPELAHDVYEEFMTSRGLRFGDLTKNGSYILPVVHLEAHYRAPLWLGDEVVLNVRIEDIRAHRYTVSVDFVLANGTVAAHCKTVHAAADINTRKAIALPESLLAALHGDA